MRGLLIPMCVMFAACAASHQSASDASAEPDLDASEATTEPVEEVASFELPPSFTVLAATATVDGDVCVSGYRWGSDGSSLLPDVEHGDAYVACFDRSGVTRARTWDCGSMNRISRLTAHPSGDLIAASHAGCLAPLTSAYLMRLDRALETRAELTFSSAASPGPYVSEIAAAGDFVVVAGSVRSPARIGDADAHGAFVAVLSRDDLAVVRVIASPHGDGRREDGTVRHVALRGDGTALYFGLDLEGGEFEPEGGVFVRTMALPDGPLEPVGERSWRAQYGVLWHPDDLPVVFGTAGGTMLRVEVGGARHDLPTQNLSLPNAAFRDRDLLVARPFARELTIAGRTFTTAGTGGGLLVAVDGISIEPLWARELVGGYRDYVIAVVPDGAIGVVGRDPVSPMAPGMNLTFYD